MGFICAKIVLLFIYMISKRLNLFKINAKTIGIAGQLKMI